MSEQVTALQALVGAAVAAYQRRFGAAPGWVGWGPGRLNVIGEHTDYNLGLAMPAAIDRWVVVALGRRPDGRLVVRSADFDDEFSSPMGGALDAAAPSWQRFSTGCVAEVDRLRAVGSGIQALVTGNVPLGAGLSSSAAVEMAWLNALRALTEAPISDLELCRLGQRVEHRHLRLASGLLDQLASQLSRSGQLMVVDFQDLSVEHFPLGMPDWAWLVVDSGVRRELAESAYRDRVAECALGLALARGLDPELQGMRGLLPTHLRALDRAGRPVVAKRLGHVLAENARVEAMRSALRLEDAASAGALLLASHASLRDDYQVSCVELDALVEICAAWPGCVGARMVGGGFGGCVLALVRADALDGLPVHLARAYTKPRHHGLRCWRFHLVDGADARPWPT